ncbi:TetR/AcrR family transcriptional regulator [Loigolactobacillus bifermentans]|jgi:AcrR family transcriptional regulator|uniref:HTH tetR-type domain-containing protein n=1 Tax=Loigolactobacillus bifermentans DSM 20003 TaxID=1423726 RepID=A0A0R1H6M7_9LACO|nr:TetR/AcrR family transcriptional regulator [Loigolactobacillus bifermentans]KRK39489.1 hypothetical protein FC07_GL002458 [Loigolactobacillus bifermentans DSM 20003]QGG61256.1 TetR family transcriptional regulator [Loigolactobacillus bifermentans]
MTKRDEAAEATKQLLIETADRLFGQHGFENLSVEDITAASGVAKGTFYHHFKSKSDIIPAIIQSHLADFNLTVPVEEDATAIDGIGLYLEQFVELLLNFNVRRARQWIQYIVEPSNQQKWLDDWLSMKKFLTTLIKDQKLAESTPIDQLAKQLMTEIYGVMVSWCISPDDVSPKVVITDFNKNQLPYILETYLQSNS